MARSASASETSHPNAPKLCVVDRRSTPKRRPNDARTSPKRRPNQPAVCVLELQPRPARTSPTRNRPRNLRRSSAIAPRSSPNRRPNNLRIRVMRVPRSLDLGVWTMIPSTILGTRVMLPNPSAGAPRFGGHWSLAQSESTVITRGQLMNVRVLGPRI